MIKQLIKNQIRKMGMFRQLERDNINLKTQLNSLEKANHDLKSQINVLESENEHLNFELEQKSKVSGFSLNTDLRGLSTDAGKLPVLKYIVENVPKDAHILDVGFGAGAYGKLLRSFYYENIDGLDVHGDHIKEMGLDKIYDNIFIENAIGFDFEYYDLIIMGDVLEHMEIESAKNLLNSYIEANKCGKIIISVPYHYEQGERYGNSYEIHLQPEMDEKYMEKNYPCLKLIDQVEADSGHIIATYCWERL